MGVSLKLRVQATLAAQHVQELLQEHGLVRDRFGLVVVQEVGVLVPEGQKAAWLAPHDVRALFNVGVEAGRRCYRALSWAASSIPLGYHGPAAALALHYLHAETGRLKYLGRGYAHRGVVVVHKGVVEEDDQPLALCALCAVRRPLPGVEPSGEALPFGEGQQGPSPVYLQRIGPLPIEPGAGRRPSWSAAASAEPTPLRADMLPKMRSRME